MLPAIFGMSQRLIRIPQAQLHISKGGNHLSRNLLLASVLAITSIGMAQIPSTTPDAGVKHYRLTFVVSMGQNSAAEQSFTLDVPVSAGRSGAAKVGLVSGSTGDAQSLVQQFLECSDVHLSATGLHVDIAMQFDREAPAIAGVVSARHQHGEFQRKVDLELGKPTVVTNEMHLIPLGDTDPALAAAVAQPAPKITVTAVVI